MKTTPRSTILLLTLATFSRAQSFAVETSSVLPEKWTPDRFDKLIQKSPFAPATPQVAQVVPPNFAANLYLSSVAVIGDKYTVSVSSREQLAKVFLSSGEPAGADGLALVSVQYSEELGKSKATIKKGAETATLEFDQAALQRPVAPNAAQNIGSPQIPQQQPGMPNAVRAQQPGMPSAVRAGRPRTGAGQFAQPNMTLPGGGIAPNAGAIPLGNNPGIPRPVQALPQQNFLPQNQAAPAAPDTRRRIRIINSKPAQ